MKLTDIRNSLNEISAINGLKQVVKGNTKEVEGIKLSKEMAQAMIDWFNSSPYGRKYPKAAKARLHISLGIMSVMGLDRYAKFKGAKEELKHIKDLSKAMRDNVNEAKGKFKKDDLVYNKRTKTVGIVRLGDDASGEVKTDADGNVNVDELEKYNPIKNKHQSNAKVAPSTEKEVNKRGLFNPFKNESVVNEDDNPCWKNYQMVGMKKKNGKDVPNCVPEGLKEGVMSDIHLTIKSSSSEEDFIKKFFKKYGKQVKPNKESILWVKDLYSDVKNESVVNEGKYDGMLDVIEDLVSKASSFMDVGNQLKKHKVKYSFSTSMMPIYRLDKLPIAIVNKRYVNKADREVGDIAIGLMESIKESVLNERAEPMLTDKEQEIVRKALAKATGVDVDSEVSDTRYHGGSSDFAFEGGEDMMLYVGKYDDEYTVSVESMGGQIAMEDAKDFKSIVKAAMKMAKKYKKRLTTESKSMKLTSIMNEAKYDIGMARKGNGLTVYNKAEEEKGDYKNVAHIDSKGKVKYYDKKIPSNIKKQIEAEAKKMMEITKEETMKLKDILKESFENGKIYSNPFHTPFVKENDEERREESSEMTTEQKQAFLEAVKSYKTFGESIYRKEGLSKVYESIRNLVESAGKNMVKETEGSFDGITVSRHVKRMNESFKVFEKTLREVGTLQQRLESSYDEIGETLGKYYEINESHDDDEIEEGNEFGANRAKAIANGDSDFEVDGKKYPVKDVSKDDKDNAKEFTKENTKGNMKLTDLLNESFGIGKLPSEKLMKMKVSAKDMLASVNNKKVNESEEVEDEEINEGGFATWEMSFADMNLGGVKLSKKNVYKVKARNTVEAIKKASKMAGLPDKYWLATQTHSLKKIG